MKILVTGATGYVGSRLVPRLLELGHTVRATSRSAGKLSGRKWAGDPNVELMSMSAQDADSVSRAVDGCDVVYYLVHSMNPEHKDFAEADRIGAENIVRASELHGVRRLIYLSGLGEADASLSKHLRSRAEVAKILERSSVPATIFRAAMIIGSGSASFEILRYLVDRLPVMITPKWVSTPSQPIAITNVLTYLVNCLSCEETTGKTFDIGGPEIVAYGDLMKLYAEEAGLPRRLIFPVPVFTPRLSSYWIHIVTPVPSYIAMPLAEGLRNPAVCQETTVRDLMPQQLITCREAINLALNKMQHYEVESHWSDAGIIRPPEWASVEDPAWAGGTAFEDRRRIVLQASPEEIWKPIVRLGGETGYYYGNWLWRLRGLLDKLFGGVGLRRGRRHPEEIFTGDALDFWRVLKVTPEQSLLLVAEMKLPGEATLELKIRALEGAAATEVEQIARFLPSGLEGMVYWYAVSPLHELVFNGMLNGIAKAAGAKILTNAEVLAAGARNSYTPGA